MNHFWCDLMLSALHPFHSFNVLLFFLHISLYGHISHLYSVASFHSSPLSLVFSHPSPFPPPVSPCSSIAFSLSLLSLVIPLTFTFQTFFLTSLLCCSFILLHVSFPVNSSSCSSPFTLIQTFFLFHYFAFSLPTPFSFSIIRSYSLFFSLSLLSRRDFIDHCE